MFAALGVGTAQVATNVDTPSDVVEPEVLVSAALIGAGFGVEVTPGFTRYAVIGETQGRVEKYAKAIDGETMPDYSGMGLDDDQLMEMNRDWINDKMDSGYIIIDIGPNPEKLGYPEPTGPWYLMELREIEERAYSWWYPIWRR